MLLKVNFTFMYNNLDEKISFDSFFVKYVKEADNINHGFSTFFDKMPIVEIRLLKQSSYYGVYY